MAERTGVKEYEELIVNPTILTLVKQRGNIDCGGAEFVLIRYGNFYQVFMLIEKGHISVWLGLHANPPRFIESIKEALSCAISK